MIDNIRGMLLGLAVGDAVGTTNEFSYFSRMAQMLGGPQIIEDMIGGGPFDLEPGQWTDDTSMALCLAESLIEKKEFDPKDQMDRYVKWYREGYNSVTGECFDIGGTTRKAIETYEVTGQPYSSVTDRQQAGNGSLMRLAPVVIFHLYNDESAVDYAGCSSQTTHSARQAVDACRYFARLLGSVVRGKNAVFYTPKLNAILDLYYEDLRLDREVYDVANTDYGILKDIEPITKYDVNPSGYVVDTLKCALYCFTKTDNFRDGCLLAANMGGDADTVGAVYGQLAGAYYGMSGIPKEWLEKLAWRDKIQKMADDLYKIRTMRNLRDLY
jgi:ADP-ribosyl-[dinitrogen reductase] hydrolase